MKIFHGKRPRANEKGINALGRATTPLGVSEYWAYTLPIEPGAEQTPRNQF